jgi:hypothetical protein
MKCHCVALAAVCVLVCWFPVCADDDSLFLHHPPGNAVPYESTAAEPPVELAPAPTPADPFAMTRQENWSAVDAPPGAVLDGVCHDCFGDGLAGCVDLYFFGLFYGCHSTCNMPLHYPYYPPHHGYYTFKPYNFLHVFDDQALAPSLRGDPRTPYATLQFEAFYAEAGVDSDVSLPEAKDLALQPLRRRTRPLPDLEELLKPAPHAP